MSDVVAVRFLKPVTPFNAGEVGGIPKGKLQTLVQSGHVELHRGDQPAKSPAKPAKAETGPPKDKAVKEPETVK